MLKDRMYELSKFSTRSTGIGSKLNIPLITSGTQIDQFSQTKQLINKINNRTQQIDQLRHDYKKVANPQKQRQINNKIDQIVKENKKILKNLEKNIKMLNQKYKNSQDIDGNQKAKLVDVTRKAKLALQQFRNAQEKFSKVVRQTIKRHATIIQGQITQQQVDDIITNPEKGQQMLKAKLLNSPSVQLENAVSDILDKYRDIVKLQKNMHQCMDLMQELALLVAIHGQQIDNIQLTIGQAKDYVDSGQKALVKAKQHHKSSKKKMFCIIMLILLAIGVVVIPIIITKVA